MLVPEKVVRGDRIEKTILYRADLWIIKLLCSLRLDKDLAYLVL